MNFKGGTLRKSLGMSVVALLLAAVFSAARAQTKPSDGAIVEDAPCAAPARRTYEQYLKEQRASLEEETKTAALEGYKVNYLENFDRSAV